MKDRTYLQRSADAVLDELLAGLPAVLLVGPRASGKTTTAARRAASVIRLDRPAEAVAVRADPDTALAAWDEPLLIDEWQLVPEVLGAVKRAVDDDPRPGRFILTGSAAADLAVAGWPATGRVVRVPMWGLSEREVTGRMMKAPFLSRLFRGEAGELGPGRDPGPDLRTYVELALRGAFPEVALQPSARLRQAWLAGYVDQLLARDLSLVGERRDPVRLRRYLQALAANTAGSAEHKTIYDAGDVNRLTAVAYDGVLEAMFVTENLPAWTGGRAGRAARTPRRFLVEPALLGPLMGVDERAVLRDGHLLGRVIETFVAAQLRPELVMCDERPRMHSFREAHGRHEIDLVAEAADGRVVAIEVKASSAPTIEMARHLQWLRDGLGDRFVAGVVLHTGPRPFELDDRVHALPICSIWMSAG